ncbi:hypothetical protein AA313_de0206457 [Arthrobotrys entomopaga]|nr:hypothetical protein AA313_de0206457 [Arthrobotrys entomopaga]
MAYNNRYQQPQPPSNSLNPARFAQNPTRTKSTRWTVAKTHNYDGDDWGDDDYDDSYGDIYSSPYQQQQQQQQQSGQYGGQSQRGNQGYGFSRTSTQPVQQASYPAYDAEPKPLARQVTSPADSGTQPTSTSGIQRKPSKMDRDKMAQKPTHHEQEHVESPVVSPPVQDPLPAVSPSYYTPPVSASHVTTFNQKVVNDGYTTPSQQPSSPTQSSKGSPTIRRPAEIYAAAMKKALGTPTVNADADVDTTNQPASQQTGGDGDRDGDGDIEEQPPAAEPSTDTTVSTAQNEPVATDVSATEPVAPEKSPTPPTFSVSVQEPTSPEETLTHRNSNLFLDINTDDDINRNVRLITPPPTQKSHFLTVPEPVHEPPQQVGYDSDDSEENLALFHTSTPPRRQSLSPTSAAAEFSFGLGSEAGEFSHSDFHVTPHVESPISGPHVESTSGLGVGFPVHVESPIEVTTGIDCRESPQEATANIAPLQSEAASPSEYGTHPPSSHGSPIDTSTPPTQSIGEKVSDATNMVSNAFSSLVTNAFGRDSDAEPGPAAPRNNPSPPPAQQRTREQTTSPASFTVITASPGEAPADAGAGTQPTQPEQDDILPQTQTENHIYSREATPDRFEEEEEGEEEVTIEEARTGEWGMATHVAISQSQNHSPTKSPAQSPLATEISQPLITKASQPVIHTPQPTISPVEQSAIIEGQPISDRAVSPASHASSSQSKTPSLTTGVAPALPSERRSPQPISFAEFIKRSPQSTPVAIPSPSPPVTSSPSMASVSPVPSTSVPAPAPSAPVSFKAFMTNRGNPMSEPERAAPPSSTPPAPSFKAFLSQKTPPNQVVPQETQPAPPAQAIIESHPAVREQTPISEPSNKISSASEGEALRQAILKNLDAESQPDTPDTPHENRENLDNQFETHPAGSSISGTEPNSPIIGRNPSYKGKMPQRTASLAISEVSEDRYRPQPFENAQYPRYQKQASGQSYPAPPESDISGPSKSGDEGLFTPTAQSVVGEQHQDYEPSIQEERGYQPSVTSDQFVPSPVDTVHPVKPFQMQRDFNEIPTLLNLSDILALSDSKDRIAASEKARKIHAQQGLQGTHDLQVWLHHVQQINHQNSQLWAYNSTRPGMHDLRNNPLISGRFDLFAQQNHGDQNKWKTWGQLDDGIAGSRPSTAATDDYMAPKKSNVTGPTAQQQGGSQQPMQNQDSRHVGMPPSLQGQTALTANQQSQGTPQGQQLQAHELNQSNAPRNLNQIAQVNGSHSDVTKQEEQPPEDKKKGGLGKKLRNIWGRKKDKGESQHVDEQSQAPQQQPVQPVHPVSVQPVPIQSTSNQSIPAQPAPPQNEKLPPNIVQSGPQQPASSNIPISQDGGQQPPNNIALPKQDEYLPPLSFQQGKQSPGLAAVMNISNSNSVPDLRAQAQNQQQRENGTQVSQKPPQGYAPPNQFGQSQSISAIAPALRPSTSGDAQGPPPLRSFDEDAPPPLRRISTSKPPPPRKRISSIPATVQESTQPSRPFDPSQPHPRASQDGFARPEATSGYPQHHGGQGHGPSHLRNQETSSGYEPSLISEASMQSDQPGKKSRFSVLGKIKNNSAAPSSTAPVGSENTSSPRHSIHTIASQPSTTGQGDRRSSSFFSNQLKKFDQLVVGKERANEFHQQQAQQQQQHLQSPPNQTPHPSQEPEPGIDRQQSFPTDGSNSIQPTPENKKKGRFGKLISDLKTTSGPDEKKSRKPSIFSGNKTQTENAAVPAQPGPGGNRNQHPTGYPPTEGQTPQNQVPVYNPNGNAIVPIPGQYHSVTQNPQLQAPAGYVNGQIVQPQPPQQFAQPLNGQIPPPLQNHLAQGIPPPPVVQGAGITRKVSNPPPPAARFLAVPPSPPPLNRKMNVGVVDPHDEESLYAPPVNSKSATQSNYDGPPPLRPHQTSSPSPPPRIVYNPPAPLVSSKQPVQNETPRSLPVEQPPVIQTTLVFPEQESKVISPIINKPKEPEPSASFTVQPTGFVMADVITTPPSQSAPPGPKESPRIETSPPRVEITPATATETEPPGQSSVIMGAEPVSSKVEPTASMVQNPREEHAVAPEEPSPPAESSMKAASPEPPIVASNEDFDKIAVDPEGPVPETEEEERIVMSATTMPGFNDWEYF